MIVQSQRAPFVLRATAPLAWRSRRRIAQKLMGFAATELGSALDMQRAAERTTDPRLRRLFYRHGLDEARHALRFQDAARRVCPEAAAHARAHERRHAERQDLHERLGELAFTAFVCLAESRALRQFDVLEAHFAARGMPELAALFGDIGKDEHQHVSYSRRLLDEHIAAGRGREVARALRGVRLRGAWQGWRRAGRRIGDMLVRVLLVTLFIAVMPLFAGLHRLQKRRRAGAWQAACDAPVTLDTLARQA